MTQTVNLGFYSCFFIRILKYAYYFVAYDEEVMQLDRLFEEDDKGKRDDHTEGANDPGAAAGLANALQDICRTEQEEERPRAQNHYSQVSGRDAASGRN